MEKRELFRGLYSEFKVFRARDDSRGLFCGGSFRPAQLRLYLSSYRFESFVNAARCLRGIFPTFSKTFHTFLRSFFVNDDINRILMLKFPHSEKMLVFYFGNSIEAVRNQIDIILLGWKIDRIVKKNVSNIIDSIQPSSAYAT